MISRPLARRGARVLPDRQSRDSAERRRGGRRWIRLREDAEGTHSKIVQSGITVIEDDVEIQSLTSVDRATVGETRVKRGAKIDSLVQVGHACVVGEDNIICAQTGLAGSSILEKNVLLAGQVGVSGHLTIHDNAVVYAQSGIGGDVKPGAVVSGSPRFESREWLRAITAFPKLPEMLRAFRQLEKRVAELEGPETDDLPPLRELVKVALTKRPDLSATDARMVDAQISAVGTANGILPQLTGFAQAYNSGLAGTAQTVDGQRPDPYFVGGLGNAFGQVFRRDFPNERAGGYFQASFQNRVNQGDYGVDQLQLRQTEVITRRSKNQIVVDISNQMVALRQARARYSAATDTRKLQADLLEKEQRKFSLGTSTFNDLIVVQRNLVTAEGNEVAALGAYSRARVGLDQIVGETLEKNNVSVEDALAGVTGHHR